ncbi:monocarboxylate transporter 6 isoform X2 [Pseudoliparis swirei]|uniref:monocarboxylate transporter 6 isoform X2 n=1 Tax=Pseudoliparis swirei TaxID=2059687 RepID=UPI0024BD75B1|nr:monocarboxylate transporter 6 isoform X2 [Pseudoliparis swirei]
MSADCPAGGTGGSASLYFMVAAVTVTWAAEVTTRRELLPPNRGAENDSGGWNRRDERCRGEGSRGRRRRPGVRMRRPGAGRRDRGSGRRVGLGGAGRHHRGPGADPGLSLLHGHLLHRPAERVPRHQQRDLLGALHHDLGAPRGRSLLQRAGGATRLPGDGHAGRRPERVGNGRQFVQPLRGGALPHGRGHHSFQPAVAILGHYFVRRRAFANAMSSTGTALGLCTLPFLGNYLHAALGWRGSFLVLGGVLLNSCVCGAVMRPLRAPGRRRGQPLMNHGPPPPEEEGGAGKASGRAGRTWSRVAAFLTKHMAFDQLRHNARYRAFAVGITWTMLGFVVPLVYLVPYATAHGMDPGRAALLLSILGLVNIAVRPPIGVLFSAAWFKGRHVYVFAWALLVNGLSNAICCAGPGFRVLLAYVVVYGLSMSVVGSLMYTVLMEVVDMSRFPSALGLLSIMESVTLLVGPPLAGILIDRTGQYFYVFIACSAVVTSSAIYLIVAFYWLDTRDRKLSQRDQPSAPPEPARPAVDLAPGCQYRIVPTEGDKDTASAGGAENITGI